MSRQDEDIKALISYLYVELMTKLGRFNEMELPVMDGRRESGMNEADKKKLIEAIEDETSLVTSMTSMKMWMLGWAYCQEQIKEIISGIRTDEETEYKESLEEMKKLAMLQNIIEALKKGAEE